MTGRVDVALLIGAAVLLIAVAAVRWSTRLGVPTLLVYLALGVLLGESFIGIQFDNAALTRTLGTLALVLIIAEGGLTARWSRLRPVLAVSTLLATVGVLVSVAVVAGLAHLLLGLDLHTALLVGAVISSTDAAAVFASLRNLSIRPAVKATLEAESGMNDPIAVLLVVLLSSSHLVGPWWHGALTIVYELIVGALIGLCSGWLGRWLLRRAALPSSGLYPLAAVGLTVFAYAAGVAVHASGFLAVYAAGVVLGNAKLPHRQAILGFADGLGWLAQIGLFVLLGLLVSPSKLPEVLLPALIIGGVLVFVARPLSVFICVAPFRRVSGVADRTSGSSRKRSLAWGWRSQAFLSWAGLRGAVPIVLATIPLAQGLPGADWLFNVVFVLVVVFTLLQGTTLPMLARKLRVAAPDLPTEVRVETAPLERMRADILQLEVQEGSHLAGVHLDELRLPVGAAVMLVLRNGAGFVPDRDTRLSSGDSLLIVATDEVRDETESRLRAVARRGRLARWFGEEGAERG